MASVQRLASRCSRPLMYRSRPAWAEAEPAGQPISATTTRATSLRSIDARFGMHWRLAESRKLRSLEPQHGRHGEFEEILPVVSREVELEAREGNDAESGRALIAVLAAGVDQPFADRARVVQRALVLDLVVGVGIEAAACRQGDV